GRHPDPDAGTAATEPRESRRWRAATDHVTHAVGGEIDFRVDAVADQGRRPQFSCIPRIAAVTTVLSDTVNVRIMRYEDDKTSTSGPGGADAGAGRVPAPVPRSLRPLRGDARPGALPHGDVDRTPQQELRHHRLCRPRHLRAVPAGAAHCHGLGRTRT